MKLHNSVKGISKNEGKSFIWKCKNAKFHFTAKMKRSKKQYTNNIFTLTDSVFTSTSVHVAIVWWNLSCILNTKWKSSYQLNYYAVSLKQGGTWIVFFIYLSIKVNSNTSYCEASHSNILNENISSYSDQQK